jgi:putative endonuclease
LPSRVYEHKNKIHPTSFAAKYNCINLVYYKYYGTITAAIAEEKRGKGEAARRKRI